MDAIQNWVHSLRKHRDAFGDEFRALLRSDAEAAMTPLIPAKDVTRVALRLKYQVEQVVPCELNLDDIQRANSPIITRKVVQTAKEAGGTEHSACVIYALLICLQWFQRLALIELWDAELHTARATACEMLAKRLIEGENDEEFMMRDTLLQRFNIIVNGEETMPTNVVEKAVDLHSLLVIGSSGYQKTLEYLWRGWLVPDENNPHRFVSYGARGNTDYWAHFDPDRMRAPKYQNTVQISVSFVYLLLYTIAINTINGDGDLDIIEGILYVFTAGFLFDEIAKFWKVGRYYIGFWNVFNSTLYALLGVSLVLRLIAFSREPESDDRSDYNRLSYNFLAFSAPMFWMRLLLYLDTFRFFGAMLVVLKVMMKESLIFFALLVIIGVGFLQAFLGLENTIAAGHGDGTHSLRYLLNPDVAVSSTEADSGRASVFIISSMVSSILQSPDFSGFQRFSPPFGILLYYIFTFIVMVILLNILIALYNSAYESVTDHAADEYMALCASKTMQFVRAPDEHVFVPPWNLIEVFCLILPFEWWMEKQQYQRLCRTVMGIVYAPLLVVTAYLEVRKARQVRREEAEQSHGAIRLGGDDDAVVEHARGGEDGGEDGGEGQSIATLDKAWVDKVDATRPNVETDAAVLEVRELKKKVDELTSLLQRVVKDKV